MCFNNSSLKPPEVLQDISHFWRLVCIYLVWSIIIPHSRQWFVISFTNTNVLPLKDIPLYKIKFGCNYKYIWITGPSINCHARQKNKWYELLIHFPLTHISYNTLYTNSLFLSVFPCLSLPFILPFPSWLKFCFHSIFNANEEQKSLEVARNMFHFEVNWRTQALNLRVQIARLRSHYLLLSQYEMAYSNN